MDTLIHYFPYILGIIVLLAILVIFGDNMISFTRKLAGRLSLNQSHGKQLLSWEDVRKKAKPLSQSSLVSETFRNAFGEKLQDFREWLAGWRIRFFWIRLIVAWFCSLLSGLLQTLILFLVSIPFDIGLIDENSSTGFAIRLFFQQGSIFVVASPILGFIFARPILRFLARLWPSHYPPMPRYQPNPYDLLGSADWDNLWDWQRLWGNTIWSPESRGNKIDKKPGALWVGGGYFFDKHAHCVTVAGSGQGKGICYILPNLLLPPKQSWFVLDPKGENAFVSAKYQMAAGQNVVLLDPWDEQSRLEAQHGIKAKGFNPLVIFRGIPKSEWADLCAMMAEMMIPDKPGTKEPFWDNRARALVGLFLYYIVAFLPDEKQHLGMLYKLLRAAPNDANAPAPVITPDLSKNGHGENGQTATHTKKKPKAKSVESYSMHELFFNLIMEESMKATAQEFDALRKAVDNRTWLSILANAQDATSFLRSESLRHSLSTDDFDPFSLADGKTTVYVCLPERFFQSHYAWLRLVTGVCLKACNYRPDKRVNFILDEFAVIGKMKDVENAFAFGRGQNISCWIFVQSLSQLAEIYGQYGMNAFLSNAKVRTFFGIYDSYSQQYLSQYLGVTTVINWTDSFNETTGSSSTYSSSSSSSSQGGSSGTSTSDSSSWSVTKGFSRTPAQRPLLTSEEVGKVRKVITLVESYKYLIHRHPYFMNDYEAYAREGAYPLVTHRRQWRSFIQEYLGKKPRLSSLSDQMNKRAQKMVARDQ